MSIIISENFFPMVNTILLISIIGLLSHREITGKYGDRFIGTPIRYEMTILVVAMVAFICLFTWEVTRNG